MQVNEQTLEKIMERYKLPNGYVEKLLHIIRSYPPSEQPSRVKKLISEIAKSGLNDK